MTMSSLEHVCLECGKIFHNKLGIAICSSCLVSEKINHQKGIRSKYNTVFLYLNGKEI